MARVASSRWDTASMNRTHSESVIVACPPERLYDMVSDVTRTGEWSPICRACWWDDGSTARAGAGSPAATRCPAERGRPAARSSWRTGRMSSFVVGDSFVRWGYTFAPVEGGTELTESWEFLPAGLANFESRFGADAQTQIEDRTRAAHDGIPITPRRRQGRRGTRAVGVGWPSSVRRAPWSNRGCTRPAIVRVLVDDPRNRTGALNNSVSPRPLDRTRFWWTQGLPAPVNRRQ